MSIRSDLDKLRRQLTTGEVSLEYIKAFLSKYQADEDLTELFSAFKVTGIWRRLSPNDFGRLMQIPNLASAFKRVLEETRALSSVWDAIMQQVDSLHLWRFPRMHALLALWEATEILSREISRLNEALPEVNASNPHEVLRHSQILGQYLEPVVSRTLAGVLYRTDPSELGSTIQRSKLTHCIDAVAESAQLALLSSDMQYLLDRYAFLDWKVKVDENLETIRFEDGEWGGLLAMAVAGARRRDVLYSAAHHHLLGAKPYQDKQLRAMERLTVTLQALLGQQLNPWFAPDTKVSICGENVTLRNLTGILIAIVCTSQYHRTQHNERTPLVFYRQQFCEKVATTAQALGYDVYKKEAEGIIAAMTLDCTSKYTMPPRIDPFLTPIWRIGKDLLLVVPHFLLTANMGYLLPRLLNNAGVDLSKIGRVQENLIEQAFKRAGFAAKARLVYQGGDIDCLAWRDSYLFVVESKYVIPSFDPWDMLKAKVRLSTEGTDELKRGLDFIRGHPSEVSQKLGVTSIDLDTISIVPFMITNQYELSGSKINDFFVTDYDWVETLLTNPQIQVVQNTPNGSTEKTLKLIAGQVINNIELATSLTSPVEP